ncbi:MAG TPA: outer membrane beta-barrel protein [Candidatus Acidoferrum sp.]|nr:outer membrane beta-barrel protein [Candidatus Acidoferrum sp.]
MRRASFFAILLCGIPSQLLAQRYSDHEVPRYELGLQFELGRIDGVSDAGGLGARFHYNFNEHLALDSELSYGPNNVSTGSHASQTTFLVGVRAGQRVASSGFFLHARGGFTHYDAANGALLISRNTFPAFDVGGTLEGYFGARPWERNMVFRLELGALIVPYGNATLLPPPPPAILIPPGPSGPLGTRVGPVLGLGIGTRF